MAVGRRNQASIGAKRTRASQPLEFPLLQNAEQFGLQFERNLSDFIQKNSASVGNLEAANALRDGSRESTSFVSEQLAFQQTGRNRRTVEFDEGFRAAWAQVLNCARDQVLARARFSVDEHRRVCWRDGFHVFQNFTQ